MWKSSAELGYTSTPSSRSSWGDNVASGVRSLISTQVRATFNKLTPIWDEDTQRGVDRLTRGVIQDITEAEAASKYNDAGVRTPKKLTLLTAKLDKLDGSMRKLFGYCITK